MGTHPIFESDFDCLTEVNFLKLCSLFDVDEAFLAPAEHASLLRKSPEYPTKTRSLRTTCFGCAIKLTQKQTTTNKSTLTVLLQLQPWIYHGYGGVDHMIGDYVSLFFPPTVVKAIQWAW